MRKTHTHAHTRAHTSGEETNTRRFSTIKWKMLDLNRNNVIIFPILYFSMVFILRISRRKMYISLVYDIINAFLIVFFFSRDCRLKMLIKFSWTPIKIATRTISLKQLICYKNNKKLYWHCHYSIQLLIAICGWKFWKRADQIELGRFQIVYSNATETAAAMHNISDRFVKTFENVSVYRFNWHFRMIVNENSCICLCRIQCDFMR